MSLNANWDQPTPQLAVLITQSITDWSAGVNLARQNNSQTNFTLSASCFHSIQRTIECHVTERRPITAYGKSPPVYTGRQNPFQGPPFVVIFVIIGTAVESHAIMTQPPWFQQCILYVYNLHHCDQTTQIERNKILLSMVSPCLGYWEFSHNIHSSEDNKVYLP